MNRRVMRGFGLVEAMVTIVIVAILISIAVPSYQHMIQNGRTRTIAESFRAGVNLARAEAMRRNGPVSFMVVSGSCTASTTGTSWVVFLGTACSDGVVVQRFNANSAGVGVTVSADRTTLLFNGVGMIAQSALSTRITQITFGNSLPEGQRRRLQLNLTAGGLVRLCDPDIAGTSDPRYCGTP